MLFNFFKKTSYFYLFALGKQSWSHISHGRLATSGGIYDADLNMFILEDHKDPFSVDWGDGEVIEVCADIARNLRKGAPLESLFSTSDDR